MLESATHDRAMRMAYSSAVNIEKPFPRQNDFESFRSGIKNPAPVKSSKTEPSVKILR